MTTTKPDPSGNIAMENCYVGKSSHEMLHFQVRKLLVYWRLPGSYRWVGSFAPLVTPLSLVMRLSAKAKNFPVEADIKMARKLSGACGHGAVDSQQDYDIGEKRRAFIS